MKVIPLVCTALLVGTSVSAQVIGETTRGISLGGSLFSDARGFESLTSNPANLGLSGNPYWSVSVGLFSAGGVIHGPGVRDLLDVRDPAKVDGDEADAFLALIPAEGMVMDGNVRLPLITFQNRRFVFGVGYGFVGTQRLDRDFVDLLLNGYEDGRTDYSIGNSDGSRASYVDYSLGHGRMVGPVSVGATVRYVNGRSVVNTRLFEPVVDIQAQSIEVELREAFARGGSGFGLDLGVAYEPVDRLSLGASISNIASSMSWNEDVYTRALMMTQDDFGGGSMAWETRLNDFRNSEERVDFASASASVLATADGLHDARVFPARLSMGGSYRFPTRTTVNGVFHSDLSDGVLSGSWSRKIAAGVEQKVLFVSLRGGLASNLDGEGLASVGIRLGAMDLAYARWNGGDQRGGGVLSAGLNIGTPSVMP
jgi:hypothetical protein